MSKKTSKFFVLLTALLVFSFLLASCQSTTASNEAMKRARAMDAWADHWNALGESYLAEVEQVSGPLMSLSLEVPAKSEVIVDSITPSIEIKRSWLQDRTFLTVYTVISDGPGWVVFHADRDGKHGAMLNYYWVSNGINRIKMMEDQEVMSADPIHVSLYQDVSWIGYFEFPRTDPPVVVDGVMVDLHCTCPY
jgi:hypothetical protein